MTTRSILAVSLLPAGANVAAQVTLPSVIVRAEGAESVEIACDDPQVSVSDTQRVLAINDATQSADMRREWIDAATAACQAGVAKIEATRGAGGRTLTWKEAM